MPFKKWLEDLKEIKSFVHLFLTANSLPKDQKEFKNALFPILKLNVLK